MKSKRSPGFTIMELMVGMVGMAIIALAVGLLLVYGWTGWRRNVESVAMQNNAQVAMRIIEKGIRNADTNSYANAITTDANGIYFADPDDVDFATAEFTAGALVQVDSFTASQNGKGGWDVDFTLSTVSDTDQNTYHLTIYPRN